MIIPRKFVYSGIIFDAYGFYRSAVGQEKSDTTLSAEDRGIGGLGIFMVKKSMDEITYEYKDGQNILAIKKNLL